MKKLSSREMAETSRKAIKRRDTRPRLPSYDTHIHVLAKLPGTVSAETRLRVYFKERYRHDMKIDVRHRRRFWTNWQRILSRDGSIIRLIIGQGLETGEFHSGELSPDSIATVILAIIVGFDEKIILYGEIPPDERTMGIISDFVLRCITTERTY